MSSTRLITETEKRWKIVAKKARSIAKNRNHDYESQNHGRLRKSVNYRLSLQEKKMMEYIMCEVWACSINSLVSSSLAHVTPPNDNRDEEAYDINALTKIQKGNAILRSWEHWEEDSVVETAIWHAKLKFG